MAESNSNLNIIVKVRDEASASLSRLSNDVSDLGGSLNFAGDKAGILASALAAIGATAVIKNAIEAFSESEAQLAKFDAIIRTLPPNLQALRGEILQLADKALIQFGFGNEEAALSLAKLIQATQDGEFSFRAFQAAMDLARFRGISLEEATQALIIAFQGGGRLLRQFGIEVDEHASKETILAAVTAKLAGQTEAYSKTLAGQLAIGKQIIGEFSEALGGIFSPAIKLGIGELSRLTNTFGGLQETIRILQPILIALAIFLAGAFVVSVLAGIAALAGMIGISATVIAWIGAIALALAGFISIWQVLWEQGRTLFEIFSFNVQAIWGRMVGFIRGTFGSAIDWIRDQLNAILGFFQSVLSAVTTPIQTAAQGVSNVFGQAVGALRGILGFQEGGIVTRPTLAMVGEGGESEAIIPLSKLGGIAGGGIVINLMGDFYTDTESAERWGNELARIIKNQLNLAIRA